MPNASKTNVLKYVPKTCAFVSFAVLKKICYYRCPCINQLLFELNLLRLPIKPEKKDH